MQSPKWTRTCKKQIADLRQKKSKFSKISANALKKNAKKVKICLNRDLANTDFFAINRYFDENQIMSEKCLNQEMAIFH
jgi:hypothetical protein